MTDIEQVSDWALSIAAEAAGSKLHHYERMSDDNRLAQSIEAHARAIEQHEAFRQEVSDAVEAAKRTYGGHRQAFDQLERFIIAKPDPLVEVLAANWGTATQNDANYVRKALDALGLEIREKQP